MMMTGEALLAMVLVCVQCVIGFGQPSSPSTFYSTKVVLQDSLEVSLYSPTMFRVRISHLKGEKFPVQYDIPFAIGKTTPWKEVTYTKQEDKNTFTINTGKIVVQIAKRGLSWTVWSVDRKKKLFPSDGPAYGMFKDGYTFFDNASALNESNKNSRFAHWFYNHTTQRYTDVYLEEDVLEDLYFIYGPSYDAIYEQYNTLVGPEPLLPRKGYGFFQTQHLACDGTQQQLLDVAQQFRAKNIPLDNLIIDFEWGDGCEGQKETTWGKSLNWSSSYTKPFSPEEMIQRLKALHIDVMLIHHSAPDFKNRKHQGWTETVYDEAAWNNAYKQKLDMGIVGSWQDTRINDITDSYIWNLTEQHQPGKRVMFLGCRKTVALNPWDFRYSVAPTENMIGARRYPFHWTEDASSSWNELRFQLKATNNTFGPLSGYTYLSSDGVAASWRAQARWNQFTALSAIARSHNPKPWSGNIDVFDFTNKIRITGRDTITAVKKTETTQTETAEASIRKYLQLRYRLLPYLYSYAHVTYQTGMPIVRPMLLAFPNDYICSSDAWPYQYMLGNEMLVAPVYGDFNTMEIYLPQGHDWIDYNTGEVFKNGGVITYDVADINTLPLFVKSGAIIPTRQATEWIDPTVPDQLMFEIFPADTLSTFTLFEDDGVSTKYQQGEVGKTTITCEGNKKDRKVMVKVGAMQGHYAGSSVERTYSITLNGTSREPKVFYQGKAITEGSKKVSTKTPVAWTRSKTGDAFTIQLVKRTEKEIEIVVE
ncbi:TIM-barrel domain-containing protein [Chryseolinea lacunae]|nr:TIM-barrel domain-containing protein [Chryseolinea lacunae]